jgi:AraC-like DNA-binding protein
VVPAQPLGVVAFAVRDRVRAWLHKLPRRRVHVQVTAEVAAFRQALRTSLVDAVVVDLGAGEPAWAALAHAADLGTASWFGIAAWRASDAPALDRAVRAGLCDILADNIDDAQFVGAVARHGFTPRFAAAFDTPPVALRLQRPVQLDAWRAIVAYAGRPCTTSTVSDRLGVSREHLSRAFAAQGGPNLKRVIDFVRLSAAASQARNAYYDTGDIARVLDFASASHLATATRRILGLTPTSLSRLRPAELAEHFVRGHARSRG